MLKQRTWCYADDVLFECDRLQDVRLLVAGLTKLEEYGLFLNFDKSHVLSINGNSEHLTSFCGLSMVNETKYLGIRISESDSKTVALNKQKIF